MWVQPPYVKITVVVLLTARPDNTGLVLMRYGLHLDVQPLAWTTVSYDSNFFSDRQADNPLRPSEWENHLALAGRWQALELSLHAERDAPADRGGLAQSFAEVQGRLLWTLEDLVPALAARFPRQDLSEFFAVGNLFAIGDDQVLTALQLPFVIQDMFLLNTPVGQGTQ